MSAPDADPDLPVEAPTAGVENYVLGEEIARGGMGCILAAEDRKLTRTVAVKVVMLDSDADVAAKRRFVREAEVLARLAHPNIVPIYDIVWENGVPLFYSMKLVKGRTLQAILRDLREEDAEALREFTLDRLLTIFRKVCDALAFAHSKGIIHRDLKPENVMIGEFGEVLVMDWGLAKEMRNAECGVRNEERAPAADDSAFRIPHSAFETLQGSVMGTPQYMSPEQARGHIDELDERSDIYSLGGILYAILTLRPPIEGTTLDEVLAKVRSAVIAPLQGAGAPPPRVSGDSGRGRPDSLRIPPALAAVAMKALSLDKAQRYQAVAALAADIEKYQGGFATSAERAGLLTQLRLLVRRHRREFAVGFAAWLIITALAVWFVLNLRASERETRRQAGIARANEKIAVQEKEAARSALAKSALALAEAALREANGPAIRAALDAVPEDLRDSSWRYLLDASDTSIAHLGTATTQLFGVAAHPSRPGVFAVGDSDRKVTVLDIRTGAPLLTFVPALTLSDRSTRLRLAFSPDGERIAVAEWRASGQIAIHSARTGQKLLAWDAPARLRTDIYSTDRLEFSPDGQSLLQAGNGLRVFDAASGALRWADESDWFSRATFTPDGRHIIRSGQPRYIHLVNALDGTLVRQLDAVDYLAFAIQPGGKMLVGGKRNGGLRGIDLADGKVVFDLGQHAREVRHLAFTPDGQRFVSGVESPDGRQLLEVWRADTGAFVHSLLGGSGQIWGFAVHPVSREFVVTGPDVRAWDLGGAAEKSPFKPGECVAFWGSDEPVVLNRPAPQATLTGHSVASVSADGRLAAIGSRGVTDPILLLRKPGPSVEVIRSIKLSFTVNKVRLSPRGDRLAAIKPTGDQFEIVDTASGQRAIPLDRTHMHRLWDLAWLGSERLVGLATARALRGFSGSEEKIILWDAATGKVLRTVTNVTTADALALAPDGRRFAEAGTDKHVRIRDAETLAVLQEFRAHDGPITALAWHPSKPILATGAADIRIRLWNLETGRRVDELIGPTRPATTLAFSPSGRRLAYTADDNTTRVWEPASLRDESGRAPK